MELTLLSIVVFSVAAVATDDFTFLESTNASYLFITEKYSFSWMELTCQGYGAELWIPETTQEINEVFAMFNSRDFYFVWIGILQTYSCGMGTLLDLHGRADFYCDWANEDDMDELDLDKAVILSKAGKYYLNYWFNEYNAICVKKNESLISYKTSDNYTNIYDTDASYKFYDHRIAISYANLRCLRDNAKLWVSESRIEIAAVFENIVPEKYRPPLTGLHYMARYGIIGIEEKYLQYEYSDWVDGYVKLENTIASWFMNGSFITDDYVVSNFICKRYSPPLARKRYVYVAERNEFVKYHVTKMTYVEAERVCEGEGASLLMVDDKKQLGKVFETINTKIKPMWLRYGNDSGLIDKKRGCCESLKYNEEFSNANCTIKLPFVCQIKADFLKFEYSSKNGMRYLHVAHQLTWHEAAEFCSKKKSSLVSFDSTIEPKYMIELLNSKISSPAFIGYIKNVDAMNISTWNGLPTDIFNDFQSDLKEFYLGMNKNGFAVAMDCNKSEPFICKELPQNIKLDNIGVA